MGWSEGDYFDWKSGSKIWPSNDPSDSPIDTFTCKLCGYVIHQQMNGSFWIAGPSFGERLSQRETEHLLAWHRDEIISQHHRDDL